MSSLGTGQDGAAVRMPSSYVTAYAQSLRKYESDRNLIVEIRNLTNGAAMSEYDYGNDELGRRTNRLDDVVGTLATNTYFYNNR